MLPKVLKAIVDALPEGASPIAPEPAIAVNAEDMSEEDIEIAAEQLGISVEELISIPKQLVIRVGDAVLTRIYSQDPVEAEGTLKALFGNDRINCDISIDTVNGTVSTSFVQ